MTLSIMIILWIVGKKIKNKKLAEKAMILKKLKVHIKILIVALVIPMTGFADEKKYEPTWSSLDSRENPKWFQRSASNAH